MNRNSDAVKASADKPPPEPRPTAAAFFGLDNTLIGGSSLFLLAQGLHERDLYGRTEILRFAWQQRVFRRGAQRSPQVESSKEAALDFVEGRSRPEVRALALEIAEERILPKVYPDMAALIERHRAEGTMTFVATAAPAELAEVVADGLGMTGALGTTAEVDETDRYSGRLEGSVLRGEAKATAVESHAAAAGIDLSTSAAYSDSISDLPLLELVGCPEVVNPDRRLRKVAAERNWPVHEVRAGATKRVCVAHRLAALGLESHVRPAAYTSLRSGTQKFTVEDPEALVEELEASGRFRRDSRLGALYHRGKVSLREVSPTDSLHITLGEGNEVSAHVDRVSPLAPTEDGGVRYPLARVAAHNLSGMVADLARFMPGRRQPPACTPDVDRVATDDAEPEAPWPGSADAGGLAALPDECEPERPGRPRHKH